MTVRTSRRARLSLKVPPRRGDCVWTCHVDWPCASTTLMALLSTSPCFCCTSCRSFSFLTPQSQFRVLERSADGDNVSSRTRVSSWTHFWRYLPAVPSAIRCFDDPLVVSYAAPMARTLSHDSRAVGDTFLLAMVSTLKGWQLKPDSLFVDAQCVDGHFCLGLSLALKVVRGRRCCELCSTCQATT